LTNLQQLRENLEKGFYLDNLYEMARLCRNLALDTASPAPFFFMETVFLNIARLWEDIPVPVEKAKQVELKLIKPLEELIEGIEKSASSKEAFNLLNRAVAAYSASESDISALKYPGS